MDSSDKKSSSFTTKAPKTSIGTTKPANKEDDERPHIPEFSIEPFIESDPLPLPSIEPSSIVPEEDSSTGTHPPTNGTVPPALPSEEESIDASTTVATPVTKRTRRGKSTTTTTTTPTAPDTTTTATASVPGTYVSSRGRTVKSVQHQDIPLTATSYSMHVPTSLPYMTTGGGSSSSSSSSSASASSSKFHQENPFSETVTGTYANLVPGTEGSGHRFSCHRCGNMRRKYVKCKRCPHIYCQRCAEKEFMEWGIKVFENGCPVCNLRCCCADSRNTTYCPRLFHCYKKCPAMKNSGQTGGGDVMNTDTERKPVMPLSMAEPLVLPLLDLPSPVITHEVKPIFPPAITTTGTGPSSASSVSVHSTEDLSGMSARKTFAPTSFSGRKRRLNLVTENMFPPSLSGSLATVPIIKTGKEGGPKTATATTTTGTGKVPPKPRGRPSTTTSTATSGPSSTATIPITPGLTAAATTMVELPLASLDDTNVQGSEGEMPPYTMTGEYPYVEYDDQMSYGTTEYSREENEAGFALRDMARQDEDEEGGEEEGEETKRKSAPVPSSVEPVRSTAIPMVLSQPQLVTKRRRSIEPLTEETGGPSSSSPSRRYERIYQTAGNITPEGYRLPPMPMTTAMIGTYPPPPPPTTEAMNRPSLYVQSAGRRGSTGSLPPPYMRSMEASMDMLAHSPVYSYPTMVPMQSLPPYGRGGGFSTVYPPPMMHPSYAYPPPYYMTGMDHITTSPMISPAFRAGLVGPTVAVHQQQRVPPVYAREPRTATTVEENSDIGKTATKEWEAEAEKEGLPETPATVTATTGTEVPEKDATAATVILPTETENTGDTVGLPSHHTIDYPTVTPEKSRTSTTSLSSSAALPSSGSTVVYPSTVGYPLTYYPYPYPYPMYSGGAGGGLTSSSGTMTTVPYGSYISPLRSSSTSTVTTAGSGFTSGSMLPSGMVPRGSGSNGSSGTTPHSSTLSTAAICNPLYTMSNPVPSYRSSGNDDSKEELIPRVEEGTTESRVSTIPTVNVLPSEDYRTDGDGRPPGTIVDASPGTIDDASTIVSSVTNDGDYDATTLISSSLAPSSTTDHPASNPSSAAEGLQRIDNDTIVV